jgi:lactate dehydrogenase-like 2-hydroxyacid dehydrogenase
MQIGVLGTGIVGRTIATRLAGLGHDTVIGTRDPAATSGTELLLPIWPSLMGATGLPPSSFQFRIAR